MNYYLLVFAKPLPSWIRLMPLSVQEASMFSENPKALNDLMVVERTGQAPRNISCFDGAPAEIVEIEDDVRALEINGAHYCIRKKPNFAPQKIYEGLTLLQRYDGYRPYSFVGEV